MGKLAYTIFRTSETETIPEKRGFRCDDTAFAKHLERIGSTFLTGYHEYLKKGNFEKILNVLDDIPIKYKGFAYEGAGMGVAILDFFRFPNSRQLHSILIGPGQKHVYMMHVGAGWGYARLPVHPEKAMQKLDPLLRWLAIDGYGFHESYFKTKKVLEKPTIPRHLSDHGKQVYFQGVGRCLWFTEGGDPGRIEARINSFPEFYRPDLWSGLGLATAYAGGAPENTIHEIHSRGGEFRAELGQGAAFAAKARLYAGMLVPHTEKACEILCGCSAKAAADITDQALANLQSKELGEPYANWRENIRTLLASYQTPKNKLDAHPKKIPLE